MFSSKFLSGANPLNAVSSAVNKFGLFGDDGEGDKNRKGPSQQGVKPPGEQQPGAGPGKGPQQQHGPKKSGQGPPIQTGQPLPKEGSPQLHGNGQTAPQNKPGGQKVTQKAGTQPEGHLKGQSQKDLPKGPPQQGSPKPGGQPQIVNKSGVQPGSPKASSQQQVPPKTGMQKEGPSKTGAQQQQPAKTGLQESTKGSPKVGQQQQSVRTTPQQSSNKPGSQPQGPKGPGLSQAGSSSPGPTKAGSQSKAIANTLCPVCKTTELNMHTKEPPNHKTCTQCKTEVCSVCGFSPPDSDGREWLCLTCQVKRAQGFSEPSGPSMKKPIPNKGSAAQNQTPSPAAPVKKEMSGAGSPQKMQSTSAKVQAKGEAAKGSDIQKQASPASVHKMTPETQRTSGPQHPDQISQTGRKQSSAKQESGGLFGFGGAKTEAAKPEESSTKETKPAAVQKSVQDNKQEQPLQAKASLAGQVKVEQAQSETPKATAASHNAPKGGQCTCPICKVMLNMGSKDPPNYNTCTDCKSTVCNQCGFNPLPNVNEGKEWLCLNCQVKRAQEGPGQPSLQKTAAPNKTEAAKRPASTAPGQKTPQDSRKAGPQKQPDQTSQMSQKKGHATASTQQESGGFFGFGGPKSQPDAAKPAVTGKMMGFGSSIFNSASTLITSAVQDDPKMTPPLSPKLPSTKDSKSPTATKRGQETKPGHPQLTKASQSVQTKADKLLSATLVVSKAGHSTCPLCKLELNVGSQDPPNYNTCTDCKNTVCNQCGFNPMPNVKEVQEWLCLNCQMQRALGAAEPPGTPMMKLQTSPNKVPASAINKATPQLVQPQKIDTQTPTESKIKNTSAPGSPQRKPPIPAEQPATAKVVKLPESPKQVSPSPGQKTTTTTSQEESGKLFGFDSPKAQPDSAKPAESLGGKMFGFDAPKSPLAHKQGQEVKKMQPGTSPSPQAKVGKVPSEVPKDAAAHKAGQSTCPLCKVELNLGSKEPPNYNNCTECKNTVCNQCGFNPMPNNSEVKHWLCLNCQMQRALSASERTGPPMKSADSISPSAGHQKIKASNQVETLKKSDAPSKIQNQGLDTLQEKGSLKPGSLLKAQAAAVTKETKAAKGPDLDPKASPTPVQKAPPTESVTGKMFGFGSSIFSSASTLVSSAVQEVSSTTPPGFRKMSAGPKISPRSTPTASPKMSPAREPNTLSQKPEQGKKPEESHQSKEDKAPLQLPRASEISQTSYKGSKATCPLCKVELNMSSKDPPNYNTCTECKTTVCSQCGFNPIPKGKENEWLCLNCQMTRAVEASEPSPAMKSQAVPKVPSPAAVSPQRKQSTPSVKPGKPDSGTAPLKQASQEPDHKSPEERQKTRPNKPADQASQPCDKQVDAAKPGINIQTEHKQSNAAAATRRESAGFFGFGGGKAQAEAAKPAESGTGKMFGFGSSIFNSASTLITSAVQDQPKTTPPVSPKMSAAKEIRSPAAQRREQQTKPEQPQETKTPPSVQAKVDKAPSEPPKAAAASQVAVKPGQSTCPLCKVQLNVGSKDPPNYNSCTECNNTVCNQCGFNPLPNETALKEWLCLTCQTQRAVGATQPKGVSSVKSQIPAQQKKDLISSAEPEKKDVTQRKPSVTPQPTRTEAANKQEDQKQPSPVPSPKRTQEPQKTPGLNKSPAQTRQSERKQSISAAATRQESGGFFGFGGGKAQAEAAKPAESGTGKMFGFGSSIFSSASTLITSAVQDQPKTTPPVSPKMSAAKEIRSPAAQRREQQTKPEQPQETKTPPSVQAKVDKAPSEPPKAAAASQVAVKPGQSTCPLCKVQLNVGSKDPPNYNSCTECNNTVCNQCGFNTLPNETGVKEWLCLSCQTQRAVGATQPPGVASVKSQITAKPQEKDIISPAEPEKKDSTQKTLPATPQPATVEAASKPEEKKQPSPVPPQKHPQEPQKTPAPNKSPDQTRQTERKQSNAAAATRRESGGFFGFGGDTSQAEAAKPAESGTGKMFGFGSSIFNSASTLITSAVQDQPKTTPPVSPKMSAAKESRSPAAQRREQQTKPEQPQETKTPPSVQAKVDKAPSEPPKAAAASQVAVKPGQSTCPLCKVQLNVGSKDPPNYNSCTECKNTVCNQCGFNTLPNETGVKEWLCLTCQTQRAVGATQPPGVASVKSQITAKPQEKDILSPTEPEKKDSTQKTLPATPQPATVEAASKPEEKKQPSPVPPPKHPQEPQKTPAPNKSPDQTRQTERKQSNAAAATRRESGGFFGFGGDTSQAEAAKPAESGTGNMFGFGSSIFNSASTLITSAVQDQPNTTPPVSPKMSAAKEIRSPAAQRREQQTKPEQPQETKTPPSVQAKVDKAPSEPPKAAAASQVAVKPGQSTCPLCKVQLNVGSKDPPNYNSCTECNNTVCNQCGFNPLPNETAVKEWLCLTCQTQRAVGATQPQGANPVNSQIPATLQKKDIISPAERKKDSTQKKPSETAQPATTETANKPKDQKQPSPVPSPKRTQEPQKTLSPNKSPAQTRQSERKQSISAAATRQESGGFFGFGGGKAQPEAAKPAESGTGKMFGFGSSIFNSASTLITSAVQDQPKTTPPVSPKMSAAKEIRSPAAQRREQQTKPEQPQETKTPPSVQAKVDKAPSEPPKAAAASQVAVKPGQSTCPLCKVQLNVGSKDPPNYNSCTECKNTVCNQCGFNPLPNETAVKEWLCLTCQTQRAVGATQPPGVASVKSQITAKPQEKDILSPAEPEKKDSTQKTLPATPQPATVEAASKPEEKKQPSPVPPQKHPQEPQKTPAPNKSPDQTRQTERKQSNAAAATRRESGGFFGFGGDTSQAEAAKPAESGTGKMFGFGSSIFNSASTLITSAVQDQPKTTPPVSPKMSAAKEIRSPAAQRREQQTKPEQPQETKTPPSVQAKVDKAPSEPPKAAAASQVAVKPGQSTCPLCKVQLNVGSKDPPNYNSCTECNNTVCNQCGFNPLPNETALKEWLCLTCQTQRAVGATQPKGVSSVKSQIPAQQKKDLISSAEPEKKDVTQRKPSVTPQPTRTEAANKQEDQKQPSPVPSPKRMQEPQKTPGLNKSPAQTRQTERKQSISAAATRQESGGFFGFGGGKAQPEAAKPAESGTGKMFGFGSSIFNSASTLITSAVQDQPKTTPPVSPKMSAAKEIRSPAAQRREQQTKPEQPQETKTPPSVQAKVDKAPSEPPKAAAASQVAVKPGQSTCPLCKVQLNVGSKDPPNYNSCTECNNTVCNQCGFKPMPNVSEIEWLCLTCQMQRAITAAESVDPPLMKPQASPNKAPSPVAAQKDVTANTKKDTISSVKAEVQDQNKADSPTPGVPQKEEETKASFQTVITETTTTAAPPAKEITHTVTAPRKDEKTASPSTKEISITTAPPLIETADVKPQPVEVPPVNTNIEMSVQRSEDIIPPSSLLPKEVLEKKEGTAEIVQKPADQPIFSDEAQPLKALNEDSAPPVAQSTNPEKILEQQQDKAPPSEKATVEKGPPVPAKPEASQAAPKMVQPTCPLCKIGLNIGSKDLPNYNTCSECKTPVCNKCGFSPTPNSTEEKEWLCLNCQMQRALGASEPPGLPMIKPKPSPSKDVPVTTQKKATPMSTSEEDKHKRAAPTDATKDTEAPDLGVLTKKCSSAAASLPDKSSLSSTTTTDVSPGLQKPSEETSKGHPSTPQQQPPTSDTPTSISKPPLTVPGEGKLPPQQTAAVTSTAISTTPPPILEAVQPFPQQLPQTVTYFAKAAPPPDQVAGKPPQQHPPKAGTSPAKSIPPPVEPAKQASGGFFGFGGPKTQSTAAKSAESVSGKMFGFGSSFLNSASTLITSAVQDEPTMTPPTPRKMSTTAHVSPRTTPPASPKTLPAKNTEALPQTLEKKAEKQQQKKDPSTVQTNADKDASEPPKAPTDIQGAPKADSSSCPLCKADLNIGSKDPPNYNTCTECKTIACNQCGFYTISTVTEVKEWLCLNCQMQRALGASEPTGHPVLKPQPSPTKVSIPPGSELKDIPTLVQREKSTASAVVKEEVIQAVPKREVMSTIEAPVPIETPRRDSVQKTQVLSGTEKGQRQEVAGQQPSVGKPPPVPLSKTTKQEVKADLLKQEVGKPPQQPLKSVTPPAKATPPPAQPAKQESGGFFGFGGPKTQPAAAKPAESVTGKMFGFGSSIFSSASTLITTPPSPRRMSTTISPKLTPPVSPKMPPAKDTKPAAAEKSEPPQQAKPAPSAQAKVGKAPTVPPKSTEVTKVASKAALSTCPLCKVELNTSSKDPPNYNTCTECKTTVCNLCGFNPMPQTGALMPSKAWE
ncbi:hypothetical protein CgunFtcFv8_013214 [Champsocephalus gunnari]|uniref:Protein piccolo-like n=1 Tax=Champsocephalus gunnari TaxID=52237 RepID=A0AAN8DZ01_CHAGU|nr:hypothetical protein CgunFtcFv8_013214 [Champsocephalus gunnari]